MIKHYEIDARGARINPNLRLCDDVYVQARKHRERVAKGSTKTQIDRILSDN